VLSFAASDPTGGAGLQADLLTLAGMGCHPVSVLTAFTVQDTHGVQALQVLESRWVSEQAHRLLADIPVAAFKLGVLGSADNAAAVADVLAAHPDVPVVLDPVLASARGDALAAEGTVEALRSLLVPRATLVTPNTLEARRLAARPGEAEPPALGECAARLLALGCRYVLLTGTHEPRDAVVNTLYDAQGALREDRWERLPGSYHGSGCTLASAVAARLAHGIGIADAVRDAQEFTWRALAAGFQAGDGQHLPDRFFWARASAAVREDAFS
jgi:hydroxymethylpyrimidine/phosphomethylpyrimidine kinase